MCLNYNQFAGRISVAPVAGNVPQADIKLKAFCCLKINV